jgi:hypothetical protein
MTTKEAKEILKAYAGPASLTDPLMRDALAVARHDPELLAWLDQEQRLDNEIRARLKHAAPPPDLAQTIVAGRRQKPPVTHQPLLRYAALAAAVVLLLSLASLIWFRSLSPPTSELAALHNDMSAFFKVFPSLDVYVERQSEVAKWLAQKPGFSAAAVPESLRKFPAIGCRDIAWRGQTIALVCLMVDGEVVHLLIVPPQVVGERVPEAPQFTRSGTVSSAAWSRENMLYLAMTHESVAFLKKHLSGF